MAYRKLGRDNKHRKSMLATMTNQLIENERIVTPVNEKQLSQITLEILDKLNELEKIKEKLIEMKLQKN